MYLTRYQINRTRLALGWISNPYRVHQRLMLAYPTEERLLFRIEEFQILVQSQILPDWEAAFLDFGALQNPPETKNFDLTLQVEKLYRFRILANPTVTRNGKRLGLIKEEDQLNWITRQLEKNGAALVGCQVRNNGLQRCGKNPFKDPNPQTHLSVQYDGVLKVQNPLTLENVVQNGIGPAKGYGFGLLSLASYS
jgi:CRISPR system Cascade subunit CasE